MSSASPLSPVLQIFEAVPRWLPEMRRLFLNEPVRISSLVRPSDAATSFRGVPTVRIFRLHSAEAKCLQALAATGVRRTTTATLQNRGQPTTAIVVGSDSHRDVEWITRELGADLFLIEPFASEHLADIVRHYWSLNPATPNLTTKPAGDLPGA